MIAAALSLVILISLAGIIYPFRPFRLRRNALLTFVFSFFLIGFLANGSTEDGPEIAKPAPDIQLPVSPVAAPPTQFEIPVTPPPNLIGDRIEIPSDHTAKYFVIGIVARDDKAIEISTRREGSSGISYTVRLVQCSPLRFGYIAEGETLDSLERNENPPLGNLESGSISDVVSRYACSELSKSLSPAPEAAGTSTASVADRLPSDRQIRELREAFSDGDWATVGSTFSAFQAENLDLVSISSEIEAAVLETVRPLPVSDFDGNIRGYLLLSQIRPKNVTYSGKVTDYSARRSAARRAIVSSLKTETDRVEGVTWFKHANQPRYLNSRSTVYLYIGQRTDGGRPWLRMKIQYAASDWLFVEEVTAWFDGTKETLTRGGFERDNNSTIWEWVDKTPTIKQVEILRSLGSAREVILRFSGSQYHRDVTLNAADKRALLEVLLAYDVLLAGE